MHFIQEISTKEIQTITDNSHIEQSTSNINCHMDGVHIVCWEAAQTKTSVIFSKMCVLSFSSANFYTTMARENGLS